MKSNSTIPLTREQHSELARFLWDLRRELLWLRCDLRTGERRQLDKALIEVDRLRFALDEQLYRDYGRQIEASYYRAHPEHDVNHGPDLSRALSTLCGLACDLGIVDTAVLKGVAQPSALCIVADGARYEVMMLRRKLVSKGLST